MTNQPRPEATDGPGWHGASPCDSDPLELQHYKTQLAAVERISHALFQSIDLDELKVLTPSL